MILNPKILSLIHYFTVFINLFPSRENNTLFMLNTTKETDLIIKYN